jgi:uncharacterized protein
VRPVDVHDLMHRPGETRRVAVREKVEDLSTEMVAISEEIRFEGLLQGVEEGIVVSGTVSGRMTCNCARCLKEFTQVIDVEVRELFTHTAKDDEDNYPITDGEIDLEPCARDALLLSVPFAPLCKEDCQGLCPRCGGDRNVGECVCGPEVDERWAALSSLKLEDS